LSEPWVVKKQRQETDASGRKAKKNEKKEGKGNKEKGKRKNNAFCGGFLKALFAF